jgi:hypothetical protein
VTRSGRCIGSFGWWEGEDGNADAAFIALARNAFDVMMRRGWGIFRLKDETWRVQDEFSLWLWNDGRFFDGPDPFTALVEADRWYRENVEGKTG